MEQVPARRTRPRPSTIHPLFEAKQPPENGPSDTDNPPGKTGSGSGEVTSFPLPTAGSVAVEVFRALGRLLSARALIFVFGMCGFAIAFVGALRESQQVLWVFIAWDVLTVIPLIVLDVVSRRE